MGDKRMTEEEYFRKTYPDSCYGDRPLSPYWDFFQDGVEFGERQSKKKVEELKQQIQKLKAGRPKWHDLRKDPNDLPKNDRYVLIATQKRVYLGFYDCCWFSHEIDDIGDVIAWCELPTFDKEIEK